MNRHRGARAAWEAAPNPNPPSATSLPPVDQLAATVVAGFRALDVPNDAALILAVSGGADSMALLHGTARALETDALRGQVTVAHLDHGLRADSHEDARFVADAAAAAGLGFERRRSDVAALARDEGRSIEDAGREARYRFLEELAEDARWIATGHTADDSAETVLLNLLRGSGTTGLRGIPARRGRILRPLLGVRRATLRSLMDTAGLAYRDDPSNDDPAYLRNRVRGELLPLLESLRAGAVERITRFAELAAAEDELLDEVAAAELARRTTSDGAIDWHDPPSRALAYRVLRMAIGPPAPSAERIEALAEAASGPRGGVEVELGGNRSALISERRIRIG